MGRGRQKAKATKQAREMKYYSPETDYAQLQRELSAHQPKTASSDTLEEDYYSNLAAKYEDMYDEDATGDEQQT